MSKSLGKGLSSLIPNSKQTAEPVAVTTGAAWLRDSNKEILEVAPGKIVANPYQPRKVFTEEKLADLKESIRTHGILQPLVVTKNNQGQYELIAGERRLRAAQELHLKSVPIIIRSAGELEKLELSLIENIQRQDLNAIERAEAYRKLIDEFSLTHEQAAKRLGKSRPVVSNTLRLLDLPSKVQAMIANGEISDSMALTILEIDNSKEQASFAQRIVDQHLTKQEARIIIKKSGLSSRTRPQLSKDAEVLAYEQQLQELLKTRVKIGRRGKSGWIIEIDAYSKEELDSITDKLFK